MKQPKKQEQNFTDTFFSYLIVLILGIVIGIIIYSSAIESKQIERNALNCTSQNKTWLEQGYNLGVNATFNYINSICRPIQLNNDTRFIYMECVRR